MIPQDLTKIKSEGGGLKEAMTTAFEEACTDRY
jgi:hypothetical protein